MRIVSGEMQKNTCANPVEKLLQKWTTSQGIIAQGTRDPGLQNIKSRVPQHNQQPLFNIQLIIIQPRQYLEKTNTF